MKDSGIGILTDELNSIKQIIEKQTLISSNEFKLKGLGLKLVIKFIELLKGKILIESEAESETNVYFILPLNLPK